MSSSFQHFHVCPPLLIPLHIIHHSPHNISPPTPPPPTTAMANPLFSLFLPIFLQLSLSLFPQILAQSPSAPAPAPSGPINVTGILAKGGQYTVLTRLLSETQVGNQIDNQLNNSHDGLTLFAPTDNAFNNLPSGALNDLSDQQQVQLVLYHVLPRYYSLTSLLTVSNPVRTQATGQDGGVLGLNFTGQGNQVNVSSGVVTTQVNNALRQDFPLAVYQVDKVLLPKEFYEAKPPAGSPPSANRTSGGNSTDARARTTADGPAPPNDSATTTVGLGLIGGLLVVCMGLLS